MKLGLRRNYHKGRAAIRHYDNQTAHPKWHVTSCDVQVDAGVGRILRAVRDSGLEDNTLVYFTSDHGGDWLQLGDQVRGSRWKDDDDI